MNEKPIEEFKKIVKEKGLVMITATQLQRPNKDVAINVWKSYETIKQANNCTFVDYVNKII